MQRLLLFFSFSALLFARFDALPLKSCEAFNNLKHTQNTDHVTLDTAKSYTVLQEHKGQKLIIVKGQNPSQRWVDGSCFDKTQKNAEQENGVKHSGVVVSKKSANESILALSWHNAFCETHRSKKECRPSMSAYRDETLFVLHGLWPQPQENSYCGVSYELKQFDTNRHWNRLPQPTLSAVTAEALERVMPGVSSHLDRHEWVKHGSCYGGDAESYFQKAISLVSQVNSSKIGRFFALNAGKVVTIEQIRFKVDESFGKGSGQRVEMLCQDGMISELWLHLGDESDDLATSLKNAKSIHSRCRQGQIDRAGYR